MNISGFASAISRAISNSLSVSTRTPGLNSFQLSAAFRGASMSPVVRASSNNVTNSARHNVQNLAASISNVRPLTTNSPSVLQGGLRIPPMAQRVMNAINNQSNGTGTLSGLAFGNGSNSLETLKPELPPLAQQLKAAVESFEATRTSRQNSNSSNSLETPKSTLPPLAQQLKAAVENFEATRRTQQDTHVDNPLETPKRDIQSVEEQIKGLVYDFETLRRGSRTLSIVPGKSENSGYSDESGA